MTYRKSASDSPEETSRIMSSQPNSDGLGAGDWRERLNLVLETMSEVSEQTDPQEMVRVYTSRMRATIPNDAYIPLGRGDLPPPLYRITRWSHWTEPINP